MFVDTHSLSPTNVYTHTHPHAHTSIGQAGISLWALCNFLCTSLYLVFF
jgi:hypothetical protein